MGALINQTIAFVTSPLSVGMTLLVLVFLCAGRARRLARMLLGVAILGLYVFSSGWMADLLGARLERLYPPRAVEDFPTADAVLILGGGVGENPGVLLHPEMFPAADRVAEGARLYRAGKAPRVFVTFESDAALLVEWGVPRAAISVSGTPRNTEEEVRRLAKDLSGDASRRARILLVTSAWHLRRAMLLCEKYATALEVVPAPCDYETLVNINKPFRFRTLLPSADGLVRSSYYLKEYIGYWGYRLRL